jgi:hypothetical protein
MPRIRTLKPESLQHRKVGRLTDRQFRLWVGMITQADDEGRLVADAGQLRLLFFGYHPRVTETDVEQAMLALGAVGLIRLYTVAGVQYADLPSWHDHQVIDRPKPSKLPPYDESSSTRGSIDAPSAMSRGGSEGIGREGIGGDQDHGAPSTPSLIGTNGHGVELLPRLSPEALMALWNEHAPAECPRVRDLSDGRRDDCQKALRKKPDQAFWVEVFREMALSSFLRGLKRNPGHKDWRATFDWLLGAKGKTENYVKVAEGLYRDRRDADEDDDDAP